MNRPEHPDRGFERYLRPIFDNISEGIQILDFDWRYIYLNATAAHHARHTYAELVGRRITEVFPGIEQTPMFELLRRCMSERAPQNTINEFSYPDGSKAWFDLRIDPVPMGVLVLSIDVTAARTIETRLRDAQKMEAVGRLAGGVAHDFNNLLTVIGGYADMVLNEMSAQDRFRVELQEIRDAGERAATLTRQLLAFSRRLPVQVEVLNLNDVVARIERMLVRLLGGHIELVTRGNSALQPVLADAGQLEQVIMNLALNARDAMPDGGILTIQTDNVELDEAYAVQHADARVGPHVMLAVSDTGTGMDDLTRARVFEPFFTTKQTGQGTGLGLATVYGIVKQSGGNIWVYSEPGRGTTFKVYLPVATESGRAQPRGVLPPASETTGSETLLIVEDDSAVRRFIRNVLLAAGYTVLDAGEGAAALELARDHTIDLLLTDVMLPGIGGRELAQRIVELRPGTHVVYMSGYTDEAVIRRGGLDPDAAFVDKPIAATALLMKLRAVLDGAAT